MFKKMMVWMKENPKEAIIVLGMVTVGAFAGAVIVNKISNSIEVNDVLPEIVDSVNP